MPCKLSEAVSFNFIEPFPLCPLTATVSPTEGGPGKVLIWAVYVKSRVSACEGERGNGGRHLGVTRLIGFTSPGKTGPGSVASHVAATPRQWHPAGIC